MTYEEFIEEQIKLADEEFALHEEFINTSIENLEIEKEAYLTFLEDQLIVIDDFLYELDKIMRNLAAAITSWGGGDDEDDEDDEGDDGDTNDYDPNEHVDKSGPTGSEKNHKDPQPFHEGVHSGFVGGLKSNEEFAKLLKGELVINPNQMSNFMNKGLPEVIARSAGNTISIEMPINVAGNLDKSVLPDIEKIIDKAFQKMNHSLGTRGYKRTVNQYGQ